MQQYKVIAESITGIYGKTYKNGEVITEQDVYKGQIEDLHIIDAIEPIQPEPEPEQPQDNNNN